MKILHIDKFLETASASAGGVGSYTQTLSELQQARGHEVMHFGCVPQADDEMPRYFDFTRTRNPLALFRMIHNREAAKKLDVFLDRHPADVAHLHNLYHHLTPSILPILAKHGVAMVMTVHDYRMACPTKHFLRPAGVCMKCLPGKFYHAASPACRGLGGVGLAIESYIQKLLHRYRRIGFFMCPSQFMMDVLAKTGLPEEKLVLVRNIIGNIEPSLPDDRGEILYAGRISCEKGPDMMLDLAEQFRGRHVVIAGDGPELAEMRIAAGIRGLGNVEFTGHIDKARLREYMNSAAVVVVPSRCFENSPMTMLEAMASGKCVVVPGHGAFTEWVTDGVTGRTFTPDSGESLAAVVEEVLSSDKLRRKMAEAGRELVIRRHDTNTLLEQIEELYRESLRRCASRC